MSDNKTLDYLIGHYELLAAQNGAEAEQGWTLRELKRLKESLQENAILRDQMDRLEAKHIARFEEMTTILVGYVMDKTGRKVLVVDNDEIQKRFVATRIKRSVAKGGNIRYRLEDIPE